VAAAPGLADATTVHPPDVLAVAGPAASMTAAVTEAPVPDQSLT
jgi:hypothetical protein